MNKGFFSQTNRKVRWILSALAAIVIVALLISVAGSFTSTSYAAGGGNKHTPEAPKATQAPKDNPTQAPRDHKGTPDPCVAAGNCGPGDHGRGDPTKAVPNCHALGGEPDVCKTKVPAATATPGGPTATPGGPTATPGGPTATPGGPTATPGGPVPTVTVPNTITNTVGVDRKRFSEELDCCHVDHDLFNFAGEPVTMTVTIQLVDAVGSFKTVSAQKYTLSDTEESGKWLHTEHLLCNIVGLGKNGILYITVTATTKSGAVWYYVQEWLVYATTQPCACASK